MTTSTFAEFRVPDDVPNKHRTGLMPRGDRAAGRVHYTLASLDGIGGIAFVREGEVEVDADGFLELPIRDDDAPGEYRLELGGLVRSLELLPTRPRPGVEEVPLGRIEGA